MKKFYLFIIINLLVLTSLQAKNTNHWVDSQSNLIDISSPFTDVLDHLPLKVVAYPNPTKDRLFIECENPLNSVSVYNLLGQKLKHFHLEGLKKYEFSVSDLPSGTYIITVQSGNQAINQKFTKID